MLILRAYRLTDLTFEDQLKYYCKLHYSWSLYRQTNLQKYVRFTANNVQHYPDLPEVFRYASENHDLAKLLPATETMMQQNIRTVASVYALLSTFFLALKLFWPAYFLFSQYLLLPSLQNCLHHHRCWHGPYFKLQTIFFSFRLYCYCAEQTSQNTVLWRLLKTVTKYG